jgi:mannosylglycoprotein endo-beta-mannosidase
LHRTKKPGLFLKLDITKAFDSVRWDFLLEVLQQLGFGFRWRSWVIMLLSSCTSVVILNGERGRWYHHYPGLRQADPLQPMLFILTMEPMQCLLEIASSTGLLSPINCKAASLRASLYADDATIFINPSKDDIQVVADILDLFGKVLGLITNTSKCDVYPIRCEDIDLSVVMEGFACPVKSFPCTYLGQLLHFKQLKKSGHTTFD